MKLVSLCCKAEMSVAGEVTHYHVCKKCNKPCNMFLQEEKCPD